MARGATGGGGFDMGTLIKWGLLAGGGLWLYRTFMSSPATAAAGSPGAFSLADLVNAIRSATGAGAGSGAGTSGGAGGGAAVPSLEQELTTAAAGNPALVNGKMNAHQWNYFRNQKHPPDLTGEQFGAAFPTDDVALAPYTAGEFVAKLRGAGISGLGAVRIPVPIMVYQHGVPVVVWASRSLSGSDNPAPQLSAGHGLNVEAERPQGRYRRLG